MEINKNMHPILLKIKNFPVIGSLTIRTYGLMMAIAFLTGYFLLRWELKRRNKDPQSATDVIFWAAIGGVVGARLFYLFEHIPEVMQNPLGMIFSGAGLVFHGGLIGGTVAVIIYLKQNNRSLGMYADIIGPLMLIGQGIGRIGCYFAGCCHGICTRSFLGVVFPKNSNAFYHQLNENIIKYSADNPLPVHPTQLYEMAYNFIVAFLLIKYIRPKLKKRGATFALYLILAGTERFLLEFIRVNPERLWGLSDYQLTSIILVLAGGIILKYFTNETKPENEMGV